MTPGEPDGRPTLPARVLAAAWSLACAAAYFAAFAPPYLLGAAWQAARDGWRLGRADQLREGD